MFNDSVTLLYGSKCEDRHGIALPEKFSHHLSEIIQGSYYAILKKMQMLREKWHLIANLLSSDVACLRDERVMLVIMIAQALQARFAKIDFPSF